MVYPVLYEGYEIWPDKQWIWSKDRLERAIERGDVVIRRTRGKWSVRFKQYLRDEHGEMRRAKPISILTGPFNQDGSREIETIFGSRIFENPKPSALVAYLVSMIVNGREPQDVLVLDSFAGSGTTGHAVLGANAADGGSRRFILVEMEEKISREVTRERLKRVIEGYETGEGENRRRVPGLGGGFRYCRLGDPMFDETGVIRDTVSFSDLAAHVFFAETGSPVPRRATGKGPYLGAQEGRAVYLLYNGVLGDKRPRGGNVLTRAILDSLPPHDGQRVVYGEGCRLSRERLEREEIEFRQIPYEVRTG